jgi:predicted alpha/beta hydrolase family esterase/predicted acetyltransferase
MTDLILTLPGWQNSGPLHWQSIWQAQHGAVRVEQHDWLQPRRGDWMAQLEETLLQRAPEVRGQGGKVLLAAHSLGCHLVAAWAQHSQHAHWVSGALLVAPPDCAQADFPAELASWRRPVIDRLPFAATVCASHDDPFGKFEASQALAEHWGADLYDMRFCGHINADSGLDDWTEGWGLLRAAGRKLPAHQRLMAMTAEDCDALAQSAIEIEGVVQGAVQGVDLVNADAAPPAFLLEITAKALREKPPELHWCHTQYLLAETNAQGAQRIVGAGGFKGAPSEVGEVEIGYGVAQAERSRGRASAIVRQLAAVAADKGVRAIKAQTSLTNPASAKALQHAGFDYTGLAQSANDGQLHELHQWRLALSKADECN